MFDIGFFELIIIFGLGLIVLGPERLPEVARTLGRWVASARRMAASLRRELEREVRLQELGERDKTSTADDGKS